MGCSAVLSICEFVVTVVYIRATHLLRVIAPRRNETFSYWILINKMQISHFTWCHELFEPFLAVLLMDIKCKKLFVEYKYYMTTKKTMEHKNSFFVSPQKFSNSNSIVENYCKDINVQTYAYNVYRITIYYKSSFLKSYSWMSE